MKFDKKYIKLSVIIIVLGAATIMVAIMGMAVYTATVDSEEWKEIGNVSVGDTVPLPPTRGNILSADGQLMASSLPDYKIYIDFLSGVDRLADSIGANGKPIKVYDPKQLHDKDSMWTTNIDTICAGLADICPRYTQQEYKTRLLTGLNERKRY